jgi:hypothetical protein
MERLWSQADATGCKHWQTPPRRKRLRKSDRQPVATPRNNETFDGKEGVDGSSPSEGLRKPLQMSGFLGMFVDLFGDTRSHAGRTEV